MANLISVERADLSLGTTHLLDEVSLGILTGDRIGVVGRNGGGKSTLLRVLAGRQSIDAGRLARTTGLTVGMLGQTDELEASTTVHQVVLGDRAEHEWAADPRIRSILDGLLGPLQLGGAGVVGGAGGATGVSGVDRAGASGPAAGLSTVVGPLSGGERRRVALAALLVADPDVMLLDEPTNHLDVEGVAWLAAYLSDTRARTRPEAALAVVTHDRWFLDAVATRTWEVLDGRVEGYEGGYAAYVLAKAERARLAAVTEQRRDNLLRKELAWLRRGAPARTSKPKFRLEAASALIAGEPPPRDEVSLARFATRRLGKDVIDLLEATVRLGERTLLDRVTWRLAPGDRVGIVGVNGAGKSTLLRTFLGQVPLAAGKRKVGKTVVTAYLSQEVTELDRLADHRVIDAISEVRSHIALGKGEISASQLAQRLGFSGPAQQSLVRELSGGERRRLQFVRLMMTEPNVLMLDEPTNDLDIETLTAMEDVLDGWAGSLLVVSHDRYLLERMCDRQVALLGDGKVRDLPGGVPQYLQLRAVAAAEDARRAPGRGGAGDGGGGGSEPPAGTGTPGAGAASTYASYSPAQIRQARKEANRIDRQLTKLSTAEERLHAQLVAKATDHAAVRALDEQLRAIAEEREELELAWLAAAEIAES